MKLKNKSVDVNGMNPAMWPMAMRIDAVYREELNCELTITSGKELTAKHKDKSYHYPHNTPDNMGRAIDCRTWTDGKSGVQLTGATRNYFHSLVVKAAGEGFQVIDEANHFHIEQDYR